MQEGTNPASVAIVLTGDDEARLLQERQSPGAVFGSHEFLGLAFEGNGLGQPTIAGGHFLLRIAPIKGLHPEQRRTLMGIPLHRTRSESHTSQRNVLRQRDVCEVRDQLPFKIPHIQALGELVVGHQVGVGPVQLSHQQRLATGRRTGRHVDAGLAEGLSLPVIHADQRGLRGRVVIEERFVIRAR